MVANKCDLDDERRISYDDGLEKKDQESFDHLFETSALKERRESVLELFNEVVLELAKKAPSIGVKDGKKLTK